MTERCWLLGPSRVARIGARGQMTVQALTRRELEDRRDLLEGMHRLRARVFRNRLDWNVIVSDDQETDPYDTQEATYLLVVSGADEVVGHVRLLPTTQPNMLANEFSMLLDGKPAPRDARIAESSRFCVDKGETLDLAGRGLQRATFMLFAAMLEWGLQTHRSAIATATDVRMERILRRATWPLERLGAPHRLGITTAVAGLLPVTRVALASIWSLGALDGPVLASPEPLPSAQA